MTKKELKDFKRRLNEVKKYIEENDPNKYEEFSKLVSLFAPGVPAGIYAEWLNINYGFDSNNEKALTIQSIYLGISKDKMKEILDYHKKRLIKIK